MKTRLKGAGRYFPGCLYAILMLIPFAVGYFFLISSYIVKADNYVIILLLLAPIIIVYLLFLKVGEKIFDFTERKFSEIKFTSEHSKGWAEFTEFAVFFGILAFVIVFSSGLHILIDEYLRNKQIPESINGWD